MRARWLRVAIPLVLMIVVSSARATTGAVYLVWQPMFAGEYGVVISAVTYLSGSFNPHPMGAVWATVNSNSVLDDDKPGNHNAAAAYGFTIEVEPRDWPDPVPDTVHVTLHVPADGDTSKPEWGTPYTDEIVPATAQCILLNAMSSFPNQPHFVDLKIVGSNKWNRLNGIHSLKNVRAPFRPMQLSNGALQE